uniref:Uncharacterized protein n=1 Tax=Oryza sativa subsp. japonica TaxID=39947 RepID=Q9AUP9_ORYSJ|nr:Putative protein kinase Xa21 [Oryza sativa Japonica Group]
MNKLSLALASYLILFLAAAATAATTRCTFEIVVKTDGRRNAGTDARVSLQGPDADGRQPGVVGPDGRRPRLLREGEPRPVQGRRRLHAVGALQHGAHLRRLWEQARVVRELRDGDAARAGETPVDDAPVANGPKNFAGLWRRSHHQPTTTYWVGKSTPKVPQLVIMIQKLPRTAKPDTAGKPTGGEEVDLSSGAAAAASAAGRRCTSPTSHRARARSGCAPSSPGSGSSRAAVQLRRVSRGCALFVYRAAEGASSTPTPPEEQTTRAAAAAVASPLPALNLTNRGLIGQMSPLGNLTFLKFLFVPANSFTGEIPQSFGNMHHLQIIYLSNNTLQRRMPNLANCSNLKVLWLNGNNLVGQIPADLPQRFQSLQLSVNSLTGPIPVSVAKITTLKRFSCLYNNIDGSIPNDFAKLPGLVYLHLGAKIIGSGELPSNIGNSLPDLQKFQLGGNFFYGHIPNSLTNASKLNLIDIVSINSFTGVVPRSIGKLTKLSWLNLELNKFHAHSQKDLEFMNSLANCTELQMSSIYGGVGGELAPSAARYTKSAHPRENPVSASKPNGPPSSSPNPAKKARSRSALAPGATLVTYTRLPAAAAAPEDGSAPAVRGELDGDGAAGDDDAAAAATHLAERTPAQRSREVREKGEKRGNRKVSTWHPDMWGPHGSHADSAAM